MCIDSLLNRSFDRYIFLFSDCMPVKGYTVSAIYDLTRGSISIFPSEYFPLFDLFRTRRLGQILSGFSEDDQANIHDFFYFLFSNEYVVLVDDLEPFPAISPSFDAPGIINNAIVDVNWQHHDYCKIVTELDSVGCQHLQVRSYSTLFGLAHLVELAELCRGTSIQSLEGVLRYEPALSADDYAGTVSANRIVAGLTLHSADEDRSIRVDYGTSGYSALLVSVEIKMTKRKMTSHLDCGAISRIDLLAPSTSTFNELRLFSGCLNRKISIDVSGQVRNCPAMETSYGHYRTVALADVAFSTVFQQRWKHRNDEIEICRDCQYRYACTACRAFLKDPDVENSKPLKCGYDPYTDSWDDWRERPNVTDILAMYRKRLQLPIVGHDI